MNSSGNLDIAANRRPSLRLLLVSALALVLAAYIGTQVLGVLYGMIFPAQAPLPADAVEINHINQSYGVDEWTYRTEQDACAVVAFFQTQGGVCRVGPKLCDTGKITGQFAPSQHVAQCSGETKFSIFAMRWEATIATGDSRNEATRFNLLREISWTGELPVTSTPTQLP